MLLSEIASTSKQVAQTQSRLEKIGYLTACLDRLAPSEIEIGVDYLAGKLRQGHVGVGPAMLREVFPAGAAKRPSLTLVQVHDAFDQIVRTTGSGSAAERRRVLAKLLVQATDDEQRFLARIVLGELRQGALEGLMVEAVARASKIAAPDIRRALMLAGDLAVVARAALADGATGLKRFTIQLLQPIRPMLAQTTDGVTDALLQHGSASFEFKLDGARVQLHKAGAEVRVFTRRLNDVTAAVPEIVESIRRLPVRDLILDGEAIALRPDSKPHPFQTTMRRFGRRLNVAQMRESLPLTAFFFDCLHLEGEDLIDQPANERVAALVKALSPELVIPRLVTRDPEDAEGFLRQALQRGHEGVMAKALHAPYEAGSRGHSWLKVKPSYTLDLVVLAAEWGHGRRQGWLSNLHLGACDPASGGFVMLGKTFKGMTDEMLVWQTQRLQELKLADDGHTLHVRPELVVEVAFSELQESSQYPAGLALRFARVKRYRPDKRAEDADTIDTVQAIYARQLAK